MVAAAFAVTFLSYGSAFSFSVFLAYGPGVGTLMGRSAAGFAFDVRRSHLVPILASAAANVLAAGILVLVTRKTADVK